MELKMWYKCIIRGILDQSNLGYFMKAFIKIRVECQGVEVLPRDIILKVANK